MKIQAVQWYISTSKNNTSFLHIISPSMQFWEIQKCFCISKWHLEMRRDNVLHCPGETVEDREPLEPEDPTTLPTQPFLLPDCNFLWNLARTILLWGKCIDLNRQGGQALWVFLLLDVLFEVKCFFFFSFRGWCLNYYSFRAPVVYVLTMYVCFTKLFNLQFTLFFKKGNHHSNWHHKVLCWFWHTTYSVAAATCDYVACLS